MAVLAASAAAVSRSVRRRAAFGLELLSL